MVRHARDFRQRKWTPKIHDTVRMAMATCRGDRARFEKTLRDKGIDAVFRTNEQGCIYGVTFIDLGAREVYNGSRLGKEFSANTFERLFHEPAQSHGENRTHEPSLIDLFDVEITGSAPAPLEDDDEENDEKLRPQQPKKKKQRYISR